MTAGRVGGPDLVDQFASHPELARMLDASERALVELMVLHRRDVPVRRALERRLRRRLRTISHGALAPNTTLM